MDGLAYGIILLKVDVLLANGLLDAFAGLFQLGFTNLFDVFCIFYFVR